MLRPLGTILKWVVLLPVIVAVLALAMANGQEVTVHFNPFDTADPVLKIDLPLYQLGFILFILGALIGGLVAWSSQLKYRRRARDRYAVGVRRSAHGAAPPPAAGYLPRPGS